MDPDTIPTGNDHSIGDTADGRHSTDGRDSADGWYSADGRDSADEWKARSTPPDAGCSDDAHGALFHNPGPQSRDDGPFDDAGASGAVRRGEAGGTVGVQWELPGLWSVKPEPHPRFLSRFRPVDGHSVGTAV